MNQLIKKVLENLTPEEQRELLQILGPRGIQLLVKAIGDEIMNALPKGGGLGMGNFVLPPGGM